MRILILSPKLPYPPKDGGAIATLSLAKGLAGSGMEVSILAFNTKKHFFPPESIPADLSEEIQFFTVPVDTTPGPLKGLLNLLFSNKPYISVRFESRKYRSKLLELLTSGNFNFVQMEGPYFESYLPEIRKFPVKVSLRAHNLEHEIWKRKSIHEQNPLKKWYFSILARRIARLEKNLLASIDLLIPISDRDGASLQKMHATPQMITIPTGFETSEYPFRPVPVKRDIFFLGALDWMPNQEGLEWFIRKVLPLVLEKEPGIVFHIAGRNAPGWLVEKLSHPSIHYHGEVEDAVSFITDHGIMVVPLLSGSGIRIKILEGMVTGKCIVTTDIGAEGIPATNGEHFFVAENEKDFADLVLEVLASNNKAEEAGRKARILVQEKFDTFVIANRLSDVYRKMI